MKGVKEMKDILKRCENYLKEIEKTKKSLSELKDGVKELQKQIDQMAKKPMVYFKNCYHGVIIVKYEVSNDGDVVKFEMASGQRYMYYIKTVYDKKTFPNKIPKFERYDGQYNAWVPIDTIDHIELLEGVDEYCDGWVRKEKKI